MLKFFFFFCRLANSRLQELEEKVHKRVVLGSRDSGNYVSIADGGRHASREDQPEHGKHKDEGHEDNCCKDKRSEECEDSECKYDQEWGLEIILMKEQIIET